ncbi:hypothetical protein [Streptomyces sp. NPDC051561]|uniref:hypothetical protein n=1 Tax=Streptomyces sp. NPDC051561 TaxID=3365658 RepID=UPI0037BAA27F
MLPQLIRLAGLFVGKALVLGSQFLLGGSQRGRYGRQLLLQSQYPGLQNLAVRRPFALLALTRTRYLVIDGTLFSSVARVRAVQRLFTAVQPSVTTVHQLPGPLDRLIGTLPHCGHGLPQLASLLVQQPLSLVGLAFSVVGRAFSLVGLAFSVVGRTFSVVGSAFSIVSRAFC